MGYVYVFALFSNEHVSEVLSSLQQLLSPVCNKLPSNAKKPHVFELCCIITQSKHVLGPCSTFPEHHTFPCLVGTPRVVNLLNKQSRYVGIARLFRGTRPFINSILFPSQEAFCLFQHGEGNKLLRATLSFIVSSWLLNSSWTMVIWDVATDWICNNTN